MPKNKMTDEMRWLLAERRAVRAYETHPDAGLSCGPVKLGMADDNRWSAHEGVFVFHFGAYGDTHVLAYGHLENALEDAAAWLKDNAPGAFTEPDYEGVRAELSEDASGQQVTDHAEADLTYTESGWLCSYEWNFTTITDPEDLLAFVRSGPLISVARKGLIRHSD